MTFQAMRMKTDWMMEQMRRAAIDSVFEKFKAADRHYYETCEGGDEVTRLYRELEELGANIDVVVEEDLKIRDEVFGGEQNDC